MLSVFAAKLFADDSKLINIIRSKHDLEQIQLDLDALTSWANTWKMEFNGNKCKVLTIKKSPYTLTYEHIFSLQQKDNSRVLLTSSNQERDLGILITSNLKWSAQTKQAAAKASAALASLIGIHKYLKYCIPHT